MRNRDSMLPLGLGVAFSLAVHLALAAGYVHSRIVTLRCDLSLTAIRAEGPFEAGLPATITIDPANLGEAPAPPFDLLIEVDGQPTATLRVSRELAREQSISLDHVLNGIEAGAHAVRVTADPDDRVNEANEANNTLAQTFVWLPATGDSRAGAGALPDLVVAAIRPDGPLVAGKPARLVVIAANIGRGAAGAHGLGIAIDGRPLAEINMPHGLKPGEVAPVAFEWTADEPGEHRVCATADSTEIIEESDEHNNTLCETFVWQGADEPLLGSPEGEGLEMRLVSADEFEQVQATIRSRLVQPMLQTTADPTPEAPVQIVDPTNPAPTSPEVASAPPPSPAVPPTPPTPPTPPDAEPQPQPEQPDGGADSPADDQPEPSRAPAADAPAERASAPADDKPEPVAPVEAVDPADRINPLIDQTERTSPIDDRSNFAGEATEVVQNIQPPATSDEVRDDGELARPIEHGEVSPEVRQAGAKPEPDPEADARPETMEVASAIPGPRHLPAMPLDPDRDAPPRSPADHPAEDPAEAKPVAGEKPAETPETTAADAQPTEAQPERPPTPPSPPSPTEASVASPASQANLTRAQRSDAESPPVTNIAYAEMKPGGVQSVRGIKIRTVVPRLSTVARLTALPSNPSYKLHFNGEGKVYKVEQLRSTGYVNVDAPIMTALYKWTAIGGDFDKNDGFVIERLDIKLNSEE